MSLLKESEFDLHLLHPGELVWSKSCFAREVCRKYLLFGLVWAEAALGRAQGRMKPHKPGPDPFPVFGSSLSSFAPRFRFGKGQTGGPQAVGCRRVGAAPGEPPCPIPGTIPPSPSARQGCPQVIVLCVLPTLPITAWLREEVLGTVLNEFAKFRELIQANI